MNSIQRVLGGLALAILVSPVAFACGDTTPAKKGWVLPTGSKYITSRSSITFQAKGISSPIEAERIHYRENKYIFAAPSGAKEWWEIRNAILLKQDGKSFALLARIYYPILDKRGRVVSSLGCVTEIAFYDEDGDGKFETITDALDSSLQTTVHVPNWAASPRQ